MNIDSDIFNHLIYLEKSLHSFEVRSNADKISNLLSPIFYEFGSSGKIWSRQDILDRLPQEDSLTKVEATDFKATLLSEDVVLLTYKSNRISLDLSSVSFLRSSIWQKNSNTQSLQWKMVFHQGTLNT